MRLASSTDALVTGVGDSGGAVSPTRVQLEQAELQQMSDPAIGRGWRLAHAQFRRDVRKHRVDHGRERESIQWSAALIDQTRDQRRQCEGMHTVIPIPGHENRIECIVAEHIAELVVFAVQHAHLLDIVDDLRSGKGGDSVTMIGPVCVQQRQKAIDLIDEHGFVNGETGCAQGHQRDEVDGIHRCRPR